MGGGRGGDQGARRPSGHPTPHVPLVRGLTVLGKTELPQEHRAPAQRCPARWREATEGLGEVVRELGAVPAEDVTAWASGRLRHGGGAGSLIGALGALPWAAGPRLWACSPAQLKGPGNSQRRPAICCAATSSRWPPPWPKRTSTRTRRSPGGSSSPRCSARPAVHHAHLARARNPSRLAAWPTRHERPWRRRGRVSARWKPSRPSSPRWSRLPRGGRTGRGGGCDGQVGGVLVAGAIHPAGGRRTAGQSRGEAGAADTHGLVGSGQQVRGAQARGRHVVVCLAVGESDGVEPLGMACGEHPGQLPHRCRWPPSRCPPVRQRRSSRPRTRPGLAVRDPGRRRPGSGHGAEGRSQTDAI